MIIDFSAEEAEELKILAAAIKQERDGNKAIEDIVNVSDSLLSKFEQ